MSLFQRYDEGNVCFSYFSAKKKEYEWNPQDLYLIKGINQL